MDSTEIRDRLKMGSKNIDLLKQDVGSIVGMLRVALLRQRHGFPPPLKAVFDSLRCRWEIFPDRSQGVHIACFVYVKGTRATTCGFSTFQKTLDTTENIQSVFEGLTVLIDGIRKEFPDAEQEWQYILGASYAYDWK